MAERWRIRDLVSADQAFLWECLYHAIYVAPGQAPPPRDIVRQPGVAHYGAGWGRAGDRGWVAEDAETAQSVGAAWVRLFDAADRGYGWVAPEVPELSIAVLPPYRGQGIGTALLARVVCATGGPLSLSVTEGNPAQRLYQRCGFRVIGRNGDAFTMLLPGRSTDADGIRETSASRVAAHPRRPVLWMRGSSRVLRRSPGSLIRSRNALDAFVIQTGRIAAVNILRNRLHSVPAHVSIAISHVQERIAMIEIHTSSPMCGRLLLSGVPPVGFYQNGHRCPEDMTYAACLRAALEFTGECPGCRHLASHAAGSSVSCAYAWFLGVTGHAFSLVWHPGWNAGNGDLRNIAAEPADPFRRSLEALGRTGRVLLRGVDLPDESATREIVTESLQAGRPVIALGLAGPPEASLVTGYDEGGAVLMGRSFFQDMPEFSAGLTFEAAGEFRQRDWYAALEGLVVLGEQASAPPRGEVVRRALRRGLECIRTPQTAGRHMGLAAYDAWAEHLLMDQVFAGADLATVNSCFGVHDDAVGGVAELRWYGSVFLAQVASDEGWMAADLLRAAACMAEEHALMWDAWGLVGGIGRDDAKARALAEPAVRRALVDVVRASRARCAETAMHLESALAKA